MDLPTYTNIWRIEKRLYKLYDLRLPMPLPIVWIGVFVGVLVPWCVFLALVGLPFDAPWHVVYLVPPGVLTWLSTRPVIEGKRLTELLQSQLRYLFEPRTWCRMAPLSEPDEITFTARVWRRAAPPKAAPAVTAKATETATKATAEAADPAASDRGGIRAGARKIDIKVAGPAGPTTSEGSAEPIPPGVIRPAVAAAAAAAAPVADAPPWRTASAPAEGTATGEQATGEQVAGEQVSSEPEAAREAAAKAGAPPIGAEALRRLRRLAASAESGAVRPAEPAPSDDGPTGGQEGDLEQGADRVAEPAAIDGSGDTTAETKPAAPEPERHAPGGAERVADPPRTGDGARTGAAGDEGAPERQIPPDADDWQRKAREQHRKGRPPRPRPATQTAQTTQTAAEPVRPVRPRRAEQPTGSTSAVPTTQAVPVARSVEPALDSRTTDPLQADAPAARERPAERPKLQPPKPIREEPPKLRRVEAVVGRDPSGGWRRLAQVIVGGGRTDGMEIDEARARTPLTESKRIMVLGCTGGAGQTITALMLGHTLARYREDGVLALDANAGNDTLTTRIAAESPETLSSLLKGSGSLRGYLGMRAYTSRCESGLEVVGADTDDQAAQRLADRSFMADWRRTLSALERHYRLTVIDPAAALAARLLPYADQLVLVAPASDAAPEAIAMTYEWLDGHGCSELRRRAVMVINGVSRRSLPDVEQAEAVASGRCRAIVRVPWEDELAPGRPGPVDVNHLRAGGRRAYVALAGVIVSSLAANRSGDPRRVRERAGEKAGE